MGSASSSSVASRLMCHFAFDCPEMALRPRSLPMDWADLSPIDRQRREMACSAMSARGHRLLGHRSTGFTLLEVLIALTVASIALMAAMRAGGSLAQASAEMRLRTHAQWSAENRLSAIRLTGEFPPLGRRSFECAIGSVALRCVEEVFATPNPSFRRIELGVENPADRHRLARLTGFAVNQP